MEYLIHYANGEEAFLAHHGVKGMHWGVRNEDTLAKYNNSRSLDRMRSRIDKQAQKLQGAAYREYNNPHVKRYAGQTRAQARKLTNMQVRYHAKAAKLKGEKADNVDKTALHIRKAERNINLATGAGVAAAGVLGGVAAYNIAKSSKQNKKALAKKDEIYRLNLKQVKQEAKRGSEETHKILEAQRKGEIEVHGAVFDGHGGTTIMTSKKQSSQKPKDYPSEKQINDAATIMSTFKEKQRSGQRMTYADYKQLQRDLERVSKSR